jgi:pimeloyl-[acyl-carrier protein] methyl ester esterase
MTSEPWIERRGRGPALVLLHGWGLNLRVFDTLAQQFEAQHEIIAIDLPGHGRSAEPDALAQHDRWHSEALADWLLPLLPARAAILGWSLGGLLALALARRAPQRVRALVLVASTPRFVSAPDWPHAVAPAVLARFADALTRDHARTVREFLELQVRGSRDATATLATLQHALLEHGATGAATNSAALGRALALLRSADLRGALASISAPCLVLGGQYDRITPPAATRALAAALPNAQHAEFARCGHAPFLSHAAPFEARVREFLECVAA